jgi:hypothetical protein
MTRSHPLDGLQQLPRFGGALLGAALVLMLLLGTAPAVAQDEAGLSEEDLACLSCHSKPNLRKTLDNGERRSLYVPSKGFAASVHGAEGCESCHYDIDPDTHGERTWLSVEEDAALRRTRSLDMMETCRDCHRRAARQYEDSVHSSLVKFGSDQAPLCSDCHNPHLTMALDDGGVHADGMMCQNCHEPIARAHKTSVHGRPGDDALACHDCHRAHDVKAASLGDHLRDQCLTCHEDVATTHADWLPSTERHLEAVACVACHSPGTTRRVNLRLFEGGAPHQAADKLGVPQFVKLSANGEVAAAGLDGRALWGLLQSLNTNGAETRTVVRGRLEVRTGVEAHSLADKSQALGDCAACHRKGAAAFQSVTISMAGPDGLPLHHEASSEILNSVASLASIGGFYMIGSNRILLLDILLLLALAAGILIPATHLTVKLVAARLRAKFESTAMPGGDDTHQPS